MKITPAIAAKIAELREQGVAVSALAERFGVEKQTIFKVLRQAREGKKLTMRARMGSKATDRDRLRTSRD